jgi:hypothetical protein
MNVIFNQKLIINNVIHIKKKLLKDFSKALILIISITLYIFLINNNKKKYIITQ